MSGLHTTTKNSFLLNLHINAVFTVVRSIYKIYFTNRLFGILTSLNLAV